MGCRSCCQEPLQVTVERIITQILNQAILDGHIQPGLKTCAGLALPKDTRILSCDEGGTDIHLKAAAVQGKVLRLTLTNDNIITADLSPLENALHITHTTTADNGIARITRDGVTLTVHLYDGKTLTVDLPRMVTNISIHGAKWDQTAFTGDLQYTLYTEGVASGETRRAKLAASYIRGIAYDTATQQLKLEEVRTRWETDGSDKTFTHIAVLPAGGGGGTTNINGGINGFTATPVTFDSNHSAQATLTITDNKGATFPATIQYPLTRLGNLGYNTATNTLDFSISSWVGGVEKQDSRQTVSVALPELRRQLKEFVADPPLTANVKAHSVRLVIYDTEQRAYYATVQLPSVRIEKFALEGKKLKLETTLYLDGQPVTGNGQLLEVDVSSLTGGNSNYRITQFAHTGLNAGATATSATTTLQLVANTGEKKEVTVSFPVTKVESLHLDGNALVLETGLYRSGFFVANTRNRLRVDLPANQPAPSYTAKLAMDMQRNLKADKITPDETHSLAFLVTQTENGITRSLAHQFWFRTELVFENNQYQVLTYAKINRDGNQDWDREVLVARTYAPTVPVTIDGRAYNIIGRLA